ncbi:MAG: VOC family protein [Phycisphaerae bacterium]
MRIEHIAWQVKDPAAVADWYVQQLGFQIKRSADEPTPVRFIADDSGSVMLEIYNNPAAPIPNYAQQDPLVLHLALVSDDPAADSDRLQAYGATFVEEVGPNDNGDYLIMLRDPWGLPLQLAKRGTPMV